MDKDTFKREMSKKNLRIDFDKLKFRPTRVEGEPEPEPEPKPEPKPKGQRGRPSLGKKKVDKPEASSSSLLLLPSSLSPETLGLLGETLQETPAIVQEKRPRGFQKGHKVNLKKKYADDANTNTNTFFAPGGVATVNQDFPFDIQNTVLLEGAVFDDEALDVLLGEDSLFGI